MRLSSCFEENLNGKSVYVYLLLRNFNDCNVFKKKTFCKSVFFEKKEAFIFLSKSENKFGREKWLNFCNIGFSNNEGALGVPGNLKSEDNSNVKEILVLLWDWKNQTAVGAAEFEGLFEDIELHFIAVAEEYRRQGFAQLILNIALKACQKGGIENVFLEVSESNLAALRLYENLGFEKLKLRKNYYSINDHAWVLQKKFPVLGA